jgi:LacI family transcriptional regulator, gluconate utilization system Gnt-I transcriptional repressor
MADVARLAGVTKMTVSRALREPARVAASTRARIEQAMHDTGFVPNRNAGSLTSGTTRIIAALIPTIHHAVFAATVQGMADAMRPQGYHLLLGDTRHAPDEESALIDAFLSRRPDGLILTGVRRPPESQRRLARAGLPIVETWEMSSAPFDMLVGFSNRRAGYEMTRHLLACGYRRIAFINGQRQNNERVQRREAGYKQALREAGLPHRIETLTGNSVHFSDGAAALSRILDEDRKVDAVFCTNDIFAIGALLECRRRGLIVPDQFGVAGFHDLEIGAAMQPALTTVRAPAYRIGWEAARLVLGRLSGEIKDTPRIELPFEIVIRNSTRAPAT